MSPAVILAARVFDLAPEMVAGKSRKAPVVLARAALASALRQNLDPVTGKPIPYQRIAGIVGVNDHNSAMHLAGPAAARAEQRDPSWAARRDELRGLLADWLAGQELAPTPAEARHPAALTKRIKPKNEPAANDPDRMVRFRGSNALIAAIRRDHPDKVKEAA